jgi:prepilin-type N-terminal cleavage/methylation domain-containing protein
LRRCRVHARRGGFTLLEVLIVMVIAAIAITMVAPTIGRGLRQTHGQQAAATIAQDLQRGLSLAARTRHPIVFTLNTDSMVYHLVDRVDGTVYATQYLGAPESEFGLTSLAASGTTLHMMPNGTVGGAAMPYRVTVQAADTRRRVSMTRAGLIRVEAL